MFENKEYIYAVYTERSFSKAAEKLYISQPCLSAMVKKVEERLGVTLFYRNTRNIQLTEHGEKYIRAVEQIFNIEENMEKYLNDVRGLKNGRISIGANSVAISYLLPEVIKEFSKNHPGLELNIYEGNRVYLEERMEQGIIDIILDNYPVDTKSFEIVNLFNERLFVAIPRSLISEDELENYLTVEDILNGKVDSKSLKIPDLLYSPFTLVITKKGNDTRKRFDTFFAKHHISIENLIEVDQLISSWNMALNGLGITAASNTIIANMPNSDRFVYYPIEEEIGKRSFFLHYPRYKYINLPLQKFIEEIKSIIS